jgi:F-type H+-transporting ATPase subunit gamma
MEQNRAYSDQSAKVIKSMAGNRIFHESMYIAGHEYKENEEAGKPVIIVITGDRGLCGGYNINVQKEAAATEQKLEEANFITVGTKGRDYFRRRKKNILNAFRGVSENPFYKDAQTIGEIVLEMYGNKTANQIHLVYTEYHTMLSLVPKSVRLLPLDLELEEGAEIEDELVYDTDAEELLEYAASAYVQSRIFGAMLESAVCEQCARLTGMDSAVKNSEKMIDTLTLQYNQMRQSAITQEIAEIVGGANAVEDN